MTEKPISSVLKEDSRLFFCIYVQNAPFVTRLQVSGNYGEPR